ncbi:putative ribosome biogenesis GTPase RsgA [bioreactor metagenome]|uniref:Putative ribosome biogenesis GTPase RsgA n=1 Tax=bioreactor metagenome TaxID=1076179 RepID=A0A644YSC2_9ZZZZ
MNYSNLIKYGFTDRFEQEAALYEGLFPARVTEQHHDIYKIAGENGEMFASVSGKFSYLTTDATDFPAVGDWVMVDKTDAGAGNAVIRRVLGRRSAFVRKAAGTAQASQIVAANIDTVFICMSLNADFSPRRVERYLSVAWDSGAVPVIVLTKADLCSDVSGKLAALREVSPGADVLVCSGTAEDGYRDILPYLSHGKTVAFIGSSGVGKSTLINRLMGRDILAVSEIRADDRGRHTTTSRQLLLLPSGGIVIDTPGMRELQIDFGDLSKTFEDIEDLASECRFKDCSHTTEPGCAVRRAIEEGTVSRERFESFLKLHREMGYEGLNSRELEQEKIRRMFGGKGEMKQAMRYAKEKNKNR